MNILKTEQIPRYMKATINNLLENRHMLFNHFTSVPNMSYDQALMNKTDVKWINTMNDIITRNFTNGEFTIDKLAEINEVCYIVGFSNPSYFARCFQKQFGILPKDYVKKGG